MLTVQRLVARGALSAALLAGCAHAPAVAPASGPAPEPAASVVTGSRLPQRIDPVTGKVIPVAAVRTYGRGDLDRTGRPGLAGALQAAQASQP
jgi:hypothetical protein